MCALLRTLPQFGAIPMAGGAKISVLLDTDEAARFDAYCKEKGFKKSSLVARLIREHLNREQYRVQQTLFRPEDTERR